ncbi:MAG: sensor histidine kinase [Fibromonadaceae bacterium]|jgi:hypothetical protein|nr:sensor histidine kinase [Fibromonadaceae bacterium]
MNKLLKFPKWHVPPPMIHFLVWLFIYLVSFVLLPFGHENVARFRYLASIPYLIFVFSFYLNYSFLIPKFLFARKLVIYVIINLVIFIALSFLLEFWRSYATAKLDIFPPPDKRVPFFGVIIWFIFVNGLAVAVRSTSMWFRSKSQIQELELENIYAKLSSLKMQISPHFLFNTLNNVLVLIDENTELAKKTVMQLSKLLRSMLYEFEKDTITIEQEVQFLSDYSDIMLLRYGSDLKFELKTDLANPNAPIAPLLLISLLENAFKHGIGPSLGDSSINVKIASKDGKITFECSNTYFPKNNQDKSGSSIGVDNTKKRLAILYEGCHYYDSKIVGENYITKLELKLDSPN